MKCHFKGGKGLTSKRLIEKNTMKDCEDLYISKIKRN